MIFSSKGKLLLPTSCLTKYTAGIIRDPCISVSGAGRRRMEPGTVEPFTPTSLIEWRESLLNMTCKLQSEPSSMGLNRQKDKIMIVPLEHYNLGIALALKHRILRDLRNITVTQFVQIMREFHSHSDSLRVEGIWSGRSRGVVWELAQTNVTMLPARTIRISFYGGPPGSKMYYSGTLLTMLIDRVMSDALEVGMIASEKLNLTSTKYMV